MQEAYIQEANRALLTCARARVCVFLIWLKCSVECIPGARVSGPCVDELAFFERCNSVRPSGLLLLLPPLLLLGCRRRLTIWRTDDGVLVPCSCSLFCTRRHIDRRRLTDQKPCERTRCHDVMLSLSSNGDGTPPLPAPRRPTGRSIRF